MGPQGREDPGGLSLRLRHLKLVVRSLKVGSGANLTKSVSTLEEDFKSLKSSISSKVDRLESKLCMPPHVLHCWSYGPGEVEGTSVAMT